MYQFEQGQMYVGTSTVDGERQKMFVILGRDDKRVSFMHVKSVRRESVEMVDGREFAIVCDDDGFDYAVSAAAPIPLDLSLAYKIADLCK